MTKATEILRRMVGLHGMGEPDSPIEDMLHQALPLWMQYETHFGLPIGPYRADLAFPQASLVVECDGHEYHKSQEQRTHDAKRDRYFKKHGWEVVRFTGSEIYTDPGLCAIEIETLYARADVKQAQEQARKQEVTG